MTGTEVPGEAARPGPAPAPATKLDPSVPHIARVRDYWLGGRDNFAVDRQVADPALAAFPHLVGSVRTTRAFLVRAVRYLTAQAGVRQFLDIGAGIPTANSTHEVAQSIAPDALACYVDRDPVVFGHARALLASGPHGRTSYLEADLRDTGKIMSEADSMLDLTQPVAVVLNAVLQFIPDQAGPGEIVSTLLDAMPPGSYLVLSHPASDLGREPRPDPASPLGRLLAQPVTWRSHEQVSRFFAGLRLLPPGVVQLPEWRPGLADPADRPANPADVTNPAHQADPAHRADVAGPAHPADPTHPADPADPADRADPTHLADRADPTPPGGPGRPAHPADRARRTHSADPAHPTRPADLGSGAALWGGIGQK